ncbi:peptidylprolyl isomerase [Chroococcus sp. FPU101]|uniref:peptidylprolyl isomerase n=1 Tax=Chroococcus sp. FPU101 TaxID=1974212 RepID=UPI001A8C0C2F|nr:peptidylprolyl isomerase [Chroococcus sp. FPU101]GFE69733.1 PpiC-type peptidyl-prolyl cis-trans isomerase [Chroococcus sp. FPU101]
MSSEAFLTFGEQPLSLKEALNYLQDAGKLQNFIIDVLRQYLLEQAIETRTDLKVSPALTEQAIIDFRLQNQLTEPQKFQQWLVSQGIDYDTFHKRISYNFKLEALKNTIAAPKLQEYFIERKLGLDRVVLSRIIVDQQDLAEELRSQIEEGTAFEELAQEYSLSEDRIFKGMMGLVSRAAMPDQLRIAVDKAKEGDIIGPMEFEEKWALFRVEKFQSASLEDKQIQQMLQNELFEQWMTDQLRETPIKLQV